MNVALVLFFTKLFLKLIIIEIRKLNLAAASESFTVFRKSLIECYTHMNLQ